MLKDKFNIAFPNDFDKEINNKILFTGAGFSKDFGALLANEVWPLIFNDNQTNEALKHQMRTLEGNYENIYSRLDENTKKDFEEILGNVYKYFDKCILKQPKDHFDHIYKFLELFQDDRKYNFAFTSNQDLLVERCYISQAKNVKDTSAQVEEIADKAKLNFPYIDYNLTDILRSTDNKCVQSDQQKFYPFEKLQRTVAANQDSLLVKGMMNYVKLHGSFNWNHSEGFVINVTGGNKVNDIEYTNILIPGMRLFKEVAKTKQITMVMIGYSFGDQHINDVILNAVKNNGRLVIILPISWSDFSRQRFKFSRDTKCLKSKKIINAVDKYYQCTFKDFLGIDSGNVNSKVYSINLKEYLAASR